jgi:N-acetylmuramoyl-L-alanine amidase
VTPQVDILARTLYGESEVRDETDARAIASVVMNRARVRRQTVEKVCLAPKQFSCWNEEADRSRLMKVTPETNSWAATCFKIAEAYAEGGAPDITNGATHYYATYIKAPKWAKGKVPCFSTPAGKYTHVFFNDIDGPRPQDRKALDQHAPLSKDAIVVSSQVATGGTVATGVLETIQNASDTLQPFAYYLEWAQWIVIGLTLAGLLWTLWSRYKARKDGAL